MKNQCLAEVPGFARVDKCDNCDDLHVSMGPISLRIKPESLGPLCHVLEEAWVSLRLQPCKPELLR